MPRARQTPSSSSTRSTGRVTSSTERASTASISRSSGTAGPWPRSFRRRPWAGSGSPAKRPARVRFPTEATSPGARPGLAARPERDLIALVSRRHGDEATEVCLSSLSIGTRRTASSALKFCLIASGEADVYVRCGPTMEWDTAAGDHILWRAGGCVVDSRGEALSYGREDRGYRNGPFAALGDISLAPRLALPAGRCLSGSRLDEFSFQSRSSALRSSPQWRDRPETGPGSHRCGRCRDGLRARR